MAYKKAALALIIVLSTAVMGMGSILPHSKVALDKEIGPNEVKGKVLSVQINVFRRGTLVVESNRTRKTYTFYVGRRTIYYPRRYPNIGETVKVQYINDRGFLKAVRVEIVQGP
ncbi:MAG: hypothetical protein DRG50_03090 [Deltaproteobacteria bacterium]|nr:MAG: hypothetical protein DRG50_03090 [Deltaproteobacteria bacterium]